MRKISNNRVVVKKDGYLLVTPDNFEIVPLFCPVCSRPLLSSNDEASYKKFECCYECDTFWARTNSESWLAGWRPTEEQIENNIEERFLDVITFNS